MRYMPAKPRAKAPQWCRCLSLLEMVAAFEGSMMSEAKSTEALAKPTGSEPALSGGLIKPFNRGGVIAMAASGVVGAVSAATAAALLSYTPGLNFEPLADLLNLTTSVSIELPSPSLLAEQCVAFSIALPPPRMLVELFSASLMATVINVICGGLVWMMRRMNCVPVVLACILSLLVLPLPYVLPFNFAMPAMSMGLLLFVGSWKTWALAAGLQDPAVSSSVMNSLVYFMIPVEYACKDLKPVKAAPLEWLEQLMWYVKQGLGLLVLRVVQEVVPVVGLPPLALRASQMYLDVWHIYFMLATAMGPGTFFLALLGYAPDPIFRAPLTHATSPSDFWGRRWNLLIHGLFRRTVFNPLVKRGVPHAFSALLAFLVSGLFHEYAFMAPSAVRRDGIGAVLGYNLLFFVVQAAAVTTEKALKRYVGMPSPLAASPLLCTLLTTAALVPFSPLFMKPLHASGIMREGRLLVPIVQLV